MGRKTLTNRPPGTQSGKENPDKPAACGTHELLTILQFTFVRLLQLACPCRSSTFGRLLTCVSLQFFDFRSCLCSSSSKNCVLTLSSPRWWARKLLVEPLICFEKGGFGGFGVACGGFGGFEVRVDLVDLGGSGGFGGFEEKVDLDFCSKSTTEVVQNSESGFAQCDRKARQNTRSGFGGFGLQVRENSKSGFETF